jgi:nitrate ABC transporter permease subunit
MEYKKIKTISFICSILLIWQISYFIFQIENPLIPSPLQICLALKEIIVSGEIFPHIFDSLRRVMVGFSLAALVAISLGILCGYSKKIGVLLEPLVEIIRPIPPIAWIPLAILLFGLGDRSAYFIIFIGAFFPIFTNTFFGARSIPQIYLRLARTADIKTYSYLKNILLPFSLPYIFTGLKIGVGMAWMSLIAAELIGAQSGLGYFIQISRLSLSMDKIMAGMIVIGVLGLLLNHIIRFIEKKYLFWRPENDRIN